MTEPFGRIAQIWRYPVSSMGGERLEAARLAPDGVEGDRLWGVTGLEHGGVAAPEKLKPWRGLPSARARLGPDGPEVETAPGRWAPAGSPEAAEALSRALGHAVRLMPHCPPATAAERRIAPRYVRHHVHVVSTAALAGLAAMVPGVSADDPRRFRPNLVVETADGIEGFPEQALVGARLVLGAAEIEIQEPCARCAMTALAQTSPGGDLPFEPGVLHAISGRLDGAFGALCGVTRPGPIRVGDPVSLLRPPA